MAVEFKLDWDKALATITYLASRNLPDLGKGKLCKLVLLADKYHLVRFGRPITGDLYYAIENGPIPSAILERLDALEDGRDAQLGALLALDRKYCYPRLSARDVAGSENLSESDKQALDHTIDQFGKMTWLELRAITHEMPAYKKAWELRGHANRALIAYEDLFEEDDDAIAGVLEEMLETDIVNKVFQSL